jgi:hypothetical protein
VAIGVRIGDEDDEVAQDANGLWIGPAHQLIDQLDQLLPAEHLARMNPTIDPHDRLAFTRRAIVPVPR